MEEFYTSTRGKAIANLIPESNVSATGDGFAYDWKLNERRNETLLNGVVRRVLAVARPDP
jgi:hypothetical protein